MGTTSFGVGAAAGHADGTRASKDATTRLARLPVHVSADIEDTTSEQLIDPARHAVKITEIKRRAPGVFINARIDNYWLGQEATVQAVLERAAAYVAAGADGDFVPGVTAPADLSVLAERIPVPVNVLVVPALTISDLARLGIRRVSTGSLPYRAAIDAAVTVATQVRDGGKPPTATPYPQAQASLAKYAGLIAG